jgi:hypothetical protein
MIRAPQEDLAECGKVVFEKASPNVDGKGELK